jgi:iron complex transport system permease protein
VSALSLRFRRDAASSWAAAFVTAALFVVTVGVAVALGEATIPLSAVMAIAWDAISGGGQEPVEAWQRTVLLHVRLPRVLLGAVTGGGLAVAGTAMQGLFRNPMADPAVLGVSGGSAFGAVSALYLAPAAAALYWVPGAAFAGGVGCALTVYALASRRGHTPVFTLLLAGIAVGSIANALTSFVLSLAVAEWEVGREMVTWLMGSLEGRSFRHLVVAAPVVLGGSLWIGTYTRALDVLRTGEESALSVGVDVARVKRDLVVIASLITAATVAVMGIVAFVGLMVPHIARLLVGSGHRRLLPFSFVFGAMFLVWADVACRTLPLADLRLGVVTSMTGGPFFLALLLRHRRGERAS